MRESVALQLLKHTLWGLQITKWYIYVLIWFIFISKCRKFWDSCEGSGLGLINKRRTGVQHRLRKHWLARPSFRMGTTAVMAPPALQKNLESDQPRQVTSVITGYLSIVVLGASGDLAKKKTFPAIFNLYTQVQCYSPDFRVYLNHLSFGGWRGLRLSVFTTSFVSCNETKCLRRSFIVLYVILIPKMFEVRITLS